MAFRVEKKQEVPKLQHLSEQRKTVPGCLGIPLALVYEEEV